MTERSAWFRIGETLVAESKSEITPEQAIEKIRKYIQQMDMREYTDLPSAQPEIKPIEYRDCANAMLRMWIDNVVTDGEYNRIMDKLNAHWRTG